MMRAMTVALLMISALIGSTALGRARPSADEMRRMRRCDAMTHAQAMRDGDCVNLMRQHHGMQQHGGRMMKRNGG